MAIRSTIDPSRRLVVTVVDGVVTDDDLLRFQKETVTDPAFDPTFDQLVDLTGMERVEVSFELRVDMAERSIFSGESRRAIVAAQPHQLGFARQHALMRSARLRADSVRVFTSMEEARAWLESP